MVALCNHAWPVARPFPRGQRGTRQADAGQVDAGQVDLRKADAKRGYFPSLAESQDVGAGAATGEASRASTPRASRSLSA